MNEEITKHCSLSRLCPDGLDLNIETRREYIVNMVETETEVKFYSADEEGYEKLKLVLDGEHPEILASAKVLWGIQE